MRRVVWRGWPRLPLAAVLPGKSFYLIALLVLLACGRPAMAASVTKPVFQDTAAVITSPQSLSNVRGTVSITGSALHPQFQRYELYFTQDPGENWVFIGEAHTNPVSDGLLGTWETGSLPDGNYSLRLRVVRQDGNYDEAYARNIVVANAAPPPTPTPTITDTPLPEQALPVPVQADGTPVPQAQPGQETPTPVAVEQPEIPTPTPRPSPTPTSEQEIAAADSTTSDSGGGSQLSGVLDTGELRGSFMQGLGVAGAIFLAVGAFFGVRKLLIWLWYLIAP